MDLSSVGRELSGGGRDLAPSKGNCFTRTEEKRRTADGTEHGEKVRRESEERRSLRSVTVTVTVAVIDDASVMVTCDL